MRSSGVHRCPDLLLRRHVRPSPAYPRKLELLFFGGLQCRLRCSEGLGVGQAFCVVAVLLCLVVFVRTGLKLVAFVVGSEW